jgi:hypothetical protein
MIITLDKLEYKKFELLEFETIKETFVKANFSEEV